MADRQRKSRKKFGFLQKHKDYVLRARDFHKKKRQSENLKRKQHSRTLMNFFFKMVNTRTVGVECTSRKIKPTSEELWMMKTQDMGYVLQKAQNEKKIGRLSSTLHYLGDRPASKHVYFADDRRTAASCEVLEARKKRMTILERIDMALQAELQKKGKKRKLRDDELVCPTDQPAYKWRKDRKR